MILLILHEFKPSPTQGGGPYSFSWSFQYAKESDLGHICYFFYVLCGHFDENNYGVPPYMGGGEVKPSKSKGERGWLQPFSFFEILSRHFETYMHTKKLTLTERV